MAKTRLRIFAGLIILNAAPALLAQTSSLPYSMPTGATVTFISGEPTGPVNIGFAKVLANPGSIAPGGFALYQLHAGGILVSEATEPVSVPSTNPDSLFVETGGNVNTGIAIVNPNSQPATVSFGFQDPEIRFRGEVNVGSFVLPPNSQITRFINEPPFSRPAPYFGLLRVSSSIPVSVTALRGVINERSEF